MTFLCACVLTIALIACQSASANEKDFRQAVENGDVDKVKAMLARNPGLAKCKGPRHDNPLQAAAENEHKEVVRVLLAAGAEFDTFSAAALGDATELAKQLKKKPESAKPPSKALHCAAKHGHLKCVDLLLANGADPNLDYGFSNAVDWTPLSEAVAEGHYAVARLLLEHGARPNVKGGRVHNLLDSVVTYRDVRYLRALLEHKADPNALDHSGEAPLHLATVLGDASEVRLLLDFKANVNVATRDGATPLFFAAVLRRRDVAQLLLARGAKLDRYSACALGMTDEAMRMLKNKAHLVNERDDRLERTPLFWAARNGDEKLVKFLLEQGAKVNVAARQYHKVVNSNVVTLPWLRGDDTANETPLHVAAEEGHASVVRLLARSGANVNAGAGTASTPLHRACQRGHVAVVAALLDAGADPSAHDDEQLTPLFKAAYEGHFDAAQVLLKRGVEPDFHEACLVGRIDVVKTLLTRDPVLINYRPGGSRWSPLQLAARSGQIEVVKYLLDQGAEFESVDKHEPATPMQVAAMHGHTKVVTFFLDRGFPLRGTKHADRPTMLWYAANFAQVEVVKLLLARGADPNERVDYQRSALHDVGEQNSWWGPDDWRTDRSDREVATARALLDKGAKVDALDDSHRTPLHEAAANGRAALVELYLARGAAVNARERWKRTPLRLTLYDDMRNLLTGELTWPSVDGLKRVVELLRKNGGSED